jgi:hypothetical protein
MKLNDICPFLARVYRTLNRPVLRSKTDIDCKVYPSAEDTEAVVSLKVKGDPEVKLLDLILLIVIIKAACTVMGAIWRFFKN